LWRWHCCLVQVSFFSKRFHPILDTLLGANTLHAFLRQYFICRNFPRHTDLISVLNQALDQVMKFTIADFESATVTTAPTRKPKPRPHISIPITHLLLPVAPASPFFGGMNQDINTDAFPTFVDLSGALEDPDSEAIHCSVHCGMSICRRMRKKGIKVSECQCELEKGRFEKKLEKERELPVTQDRSTMEFLFDWFFGFSFASLRPA